MTDQKVIRNRYFRAAAIVIIICMVAGLVEQTWLELDHSYKFIFIIETIMLEAFGLAWIVKGELIYGDNKAAK